MNYVSAYRVLVEVRPKPGVTDEGRREEVMETLKDIIQKSLRGCDILTRVGSRHYFLLVIEVDEEKTEKICRRIRDAWEATDYSTKTELVTETERV